LVITRALDGDLDIVDVRHSLRSFPSGSRLGACRLSRADSAPLIARYVQ
jgi:hypothetical protein